MDYKEEYQKALERAKKGLPIDEVFPELKESEDERIRKELVEYFSRTGCNFIRGIPIERIMAYLEKQKEQKPAEWNEEDKETIESIISELRTLKGEQTDEELIADYEDKIQWIKERLFPDGAYHKGVKNGFAKAKELHYNAWKPSKEQMEALKETAEWKKHSNPQLFSLYNDLKKLM